MRRELALRVLGELLGWSDTQATTEFRWLNLMSRLKFDGYQDFLAGARFLESLAAWLQQFAHSDERVAAYAFVRRNLIYLGEAETQHLVEIFYPEYVQPRLLRATAFQQGTPSHLVWASSSNAAAYDRLLRQTLFIGLSDGARLDFLRRVNDGAISHEQILPTIYVDPDKWQSALASLQEDLRDAAARFQFLYLVDDFTASGTTFLRKKNGQWKGKLERFRQNVRAHAHSHFDEDLQVCVHHHLASSRARRALKQRHQEAVSDAEPKASWFSNIEFTFGSVLPDTVPLSRSAEESSEAFLDLARKYCDRKDPLFDNEHFKEGNTQDAALGFADCALPLVLEHNTPNNSMALLWAETPSSEEVARDPERHPMTALFRRRQRHV